MSTDGEYHRGLKAFNHDKSRGKWPRTSDFFYACIGHAFRADVVLLMPSMLFEDLGIYFIIPYFLLVAVCVVPIVFIQSFLGQFSSTGFISALRISPISKGIGYIALYINIAVLMYFGVYAAIPLFYLYHSLRPTLPWSCEGSKEWMNDTDGIILACMDNDPANFYLGTKFSSLEFFKNHLKSFEKPLVKNDSTNFSLCLMMCTFLVWIVVGAVLIQPLERIVKFLRYTCVGMMSILGACVLRFVFLPGAFSSAVDALIFPKDLRIPTWTWMPLIALSVLGPGWGNILTMASFNKFKENTLKLSWTLCFAQFGVMTGLGLMALFIKGALQNMTPAEIEHRHKHVQWMEIMVAPTAVSLLGMSRIWSWLLIVMLLLGSLNLLTVQLLSVLTSLFDEFESLRRRKRLVILIFIGSLALSSISFCSNNGLTISEIITMHLMVTQMLLNLLLLLVIHFCFGRERFQRDIAFMTGEAYATWKVIAMRNVTIVILVAAGFIASFFVVTGLFYTLTLVGVFALVTLMLWLLIPGCCCVAIARATDCNQAVQPVDWYPADPEDRQKYEEGLGTVML